MASYFQTQTAKLYGTTPATHEAKKTVPAKQIGGSMEFSETEQPLGESRFDPAIEKMILQAPVDIRAEIEQTEPQNFERQPEFASHTVDPQQVAKNIDISKRIEELKNFLDNPNTVSIKPIEAPLEEDFAEQDGKDTVVSVELFLSSQKKDLIEIGGQTELVFTEEKRVTAEELRETKVLFKAPIEEDPIKHESKAKSAVGNIALRFLSGLSFLGRIGQSMTKEVWSAGKGISAEVRKSPPKEKDKKPEVTEEQVVAKQNAAAIEQAVDLQKQLRRQAREADADRLTKGKIRELPEDGLAKALGLQPGALKVLARAEGIDISKAVDLDITVTENEEKQKENAQRAKERSVAASTGQKQDKPAVEEGGNKMSGPTHGIG